MTRKAIENFVVCRLHPPFTPHALRLPLVAAIFRLIVPLCLAVAALPGCAVIYTVIKSEAKLDRLSVPMSKDQVVDEIGKPDRVLRDDGRVLVWEYSLTARKQWLYELALCPLSVWVGGCVIYPFTNIAAEHNREYPFHVILVNEELCAWGPPLAILQKRKACAAPGSLVMKGPGGEGRPDRRPQPVVTGIGPINREMIERYRSMAVMLFEDAPGTQGTGARVAGIVTTLLLDLDMNIVERTRLEQVFKEQVTRLEHGDDTDALQIGKLVGANAIVVGEVQQWETNPSEGTNRVSLSLRMIDVESGLLLFNGEGHVLDPTADDPETLARTIAHRILVRFGTKTGLLGTGRIGVNWELRESSRGKFYLVREIKSGSPADQAGLKVGDVVVSCHGTALDSVKSEREAKRLCQVEAGQPLSLDVRRADQRIIILSIAEPRPGF
ncbi:MAG: PDZ domain-containing protein [Nitrospiraceae bacterium]